LVNASKKIGGGHIRRCLDIADEITKNYPNQIKIEFITWDLDVQFESLIKRYKIQRIEENQLLSFLDIVFSQEKHVFLVDVNSEQVHSVDFQFFLRNQGVKSIYFLANYDWSYNCDILINTSLLAKEKPIKSASNTLCLLGPDYFIFRQPFRHLYNLKKKVQNKVFISFGNADPLGYTLVFIHYFIDVKTDLEVVIIIGSANNNLENIQELSNKLQENVYLVFNEDDLLPFMENSKFAIVSVGSVFYELGLLEIPTILFPSSEMENLVAKHLCKLGFAKMGIEYGEKFKIESIEALLNEPIELERNDINAFLNPLGIEKIVQEFRLEDSIC
jgi:spore coat polysaccharide biosynthesis predicted glycosyltransferase SpsG